MGIMLLGVFIPLHDIWRGPVHPEHREKDALQHVQRPDVNGAGRYLLRSIARLDDEYENGMVDADTYQQRHQAYKEQLYKLIEDIQRNEVSQKVIETWGRGA